MISKKRFNICVKPLLILLLVCAVFAILTQVEIFYPYTVSLPALNEQDKKDVISSLGKFSIPEDYELRAVSVGRKGENRLIVYINEQNGQKLFITILREHLSDKLDEIQILNKTKVQRTVGSSMDRLEHSDVPSFRFTYFLFFILRKDDLSGMGDEAIIKGINVKDQERFETPFSDVLYVRGEFTKIGLFKEKRGIWHYPTPVFDFETLHEGALAFIKSKESGRVMVAVSVNSLGQFQEEEFREFIESFEPA
jgi:hypothetical protein